MSKLTEQHYRALVTYYKSGCRMQNKSDLKEFFFHMRNYKNSLWFASLPKWVQDEILLSYQIVKENLGMK